MSRKFSVYIVFIFTVLMVMTVSGIICIVYYENKKSARENAQEQFKQKMMMLTEKTANYMNVAQLTAEVATRVFDKPNLELKLGSEESNYLLEALLTHPQIELLYYGDEEGSYLQAADFAEVYVKVIHQKNNKAHTVYNYYDSSKKIVRTETLEDTKYDPRKRPWYIGAKATKKTFWTDPYIFFENGKPGITVSVPIFEKDGKLKGVVAADITLKGLTAFLKHIELSEHGLAFITDGKRKLLAFSGEKEIVIKENGEFRSLQVDELGIPAVNATLKRLDKKRDNFVSVTSEGREYYAAFLPFPDSLGKTWNSAILSPEDDFTGAMDKTLNQILYLSVCGLAIGVLLTTLLARKISKPIELLAEDVLRVRNLDLESGSEIHSHIHEIQTMDNAIQAMKNSLKAFRLYVPAVLVKQLIASGEDIAIGGKEKELTLFFSDIKDYTPITESTPPQELMVQLSEYFDVMTTVIENEKGTVDKFIADSVMAFWNAPLDSDNHHYSACQAALHCQRQLKKLNEQWGKESKKIFHTRIGIHTGSATVGNMGAKQRMNYTALGDSVNLASRLEGINKIYKTNILISHSTYSHIKNLFVCRIIDDIAAKGKNENIRIYELLTEHDSPEAERFTDFANKFQLIYDLYIKQEWQKALDLLLIFQKEFPHDYVCRIYLDRCKDNSGRAPSKSWSNVTRIDVK